MNKSKALERSMRGVSGHDEDEAMKSLEDKTPGKQSSKSAKPKHGPMRQIRIERSGNGGFISNPDHEPLPSAGKSKDTSSLLDHSPQPLTHSSLQDVHDYLDEQWGGK